MSEKKENILDPWDQCPMSFHQAGDMKKHRKTHSVEKTLCKVIFRR